MCRVLKMPRSTYYDSFHRKPNSYHVANEELLEQITAVHKESKGRYGAPKIHKELLRKGYLTSLKRVQRLMKEAGIRSNITKKYRPTPSQSPVEERENVLEQDFTTTINEKWVADITYIHTLRHGWCYLASVLDLHTKKVVGYKFSRTMTTEIVLEALENAVNAQNPEEPGLIVHTDLGTQYTSEAFQERLKKYK